MKRNKILFILLAYASAIYSAKAQSYQSVISNKSLWTCIDCNRFGSFEFKRIRKEMMQGDTLIAGLTYKKMYRDTSGTFNWNTAKYICAIREQDKKVYFIYENTNNEQLLYDFTKNTGDSVTVCGLGLNYPNSIKLKIDSISTGIINGIARKTFKFNANGSYHTDEYWYEGLGSSFGFLTPFVSVSDNVFTLKCNVKNDTLYYLANNIGNFLCSPSEPPNSCEYSILATGIYDLPEVMLSIYPNPVKDYIQTETNQEIKEIRIFDAAGHEVKTAKGKTLDISDLKNGFYFITISTQNSRKQTLKFIKV